VSEFYTYLHCKPNGDPFYVGKGIVITRGTRRSHDFINGRNQHHRNIVSKHGKNNILIYVFPCDSEQQALADEIQQIAQLRAEGYKLANKSDGGEGGATGVKRSAEWVENLVKRNIGNTYGRGNKGKVRTAAMRANVGAKNKGKSHPNSPETRAKQSAANKGKVVSLVTIAKMLATRKLNKEK